MASKKEPTPLIREPIDWVRIIEAVATAAVLIMTTWGAMALNRVEGEVEKVQVQTDGVELASKKAIAISAENLAVATKSQKDIKLAEEAWEAYEAKLSVQKQAEQKNQ